MLRIPTLPLCLTAATLAGALWLAPATAASGVAVTAGTDSDDQHEQNVMSSRFCADCHPAIYAEHERSTHGRAFTDEEVRLATGRFDHGDCIICHTPRPIFETGIGMNPKRRHYDLEEGNTCMSCHWREGYDYGSFHGGPECTEAFDPRVGEVEACASCHRNHGTPFQWATSPLGKGKDRMCIDCHMRGVTRPVAVGEEPRRVSSHGFPGSREEAHLRRAYAYDAQVEGDTAVVTIKNKGAGHNFPTELKQRSLESLVIVTDVDGNEVSRSRMVFRDPYKRPYGLHLPVNTQIPSGQSVEHRVPLHVADGTVECELHFKLYYPIEDYHPDLARRLEVRKLLFQGITPSTEPVMTAPDVQVVTPESIDVAKASPANLVDYARPPIGTVAVDVPDGQSDADIDRLIELFQFPVPQANRDARKRLVEIGAPAVPKLIAAMGSWDNKTFNQAMGALRGMGDIARPAIIDALSSDELFIRIHARDLAVRIDARGDARANAALLAGLDQSNALDRASAATALGDLGVSEAIPALRAAMGDSDPDVVRAAAFALSHLGDEQALPLMRAAYARFRYVETKRDLAEAMARLGDHDAVPLLMDGLDHRDELIRESHFEKFFGVTGVHLGYDPLAPRPERLDAISRLRAFWAKDGPSVQLRPWTPVDHAVEETVWHALQALGDGGDDEALRKTIRDAGDGAVPGLVKALKFPAGFDSKRSQVCELLGLSGNSDAVPALLTALRDPVVSVASWACWGLEAIGDPEALPAVQRFEQRIQSVSAAGRLAPSVGSADALLAQVARARFVLGDETSLNDLVTLLLSDDVGARTVAIDALRGFLGFDLDYVADGDPLERRKAAAEWAAALQ